MQFFFPIADHDKELEDVVEAARVRHVLLHDRVQLGKVISKLRVGHHTLPGLHEVDVASQGVDLAVVSKEPVGVRPFPVWKRVCGKS